MNIKMSDSFFEAVKNATLKMVSEKKEKEYLDNPFKGFWVSFCPPEEKEKTLKIYSAEELGIDSDVKVCLVCDSLLGEKSEKSKIPMCNL